MVCGESRMIAVIFEVETLEGQQGNYLEFARKLLPLVEKIEGFISIERFESLANPGKILSLSFWRDEKAIAEWRNISEHRQAQHEGRQSIFSNYRIRIAGITRDYGMHKTNESPQDSKEFHA
jgi:heme-degrading monooxygenase HmoA